MTSAVRRPALFPNHYCWYVCLATLDVILTWVILHLGGSEANVLAAAIIRAGGVWGAIALKFASVVLVVGVCEYIGRVGRVGTARGVAVTAIGLSALPVIVALSILAVYEPIVH